MIEQYAADLRRCLDGWYRNPDDAVDEVIDHLESRVEALTAAGVEDHDAVALALREFGSVTDVAAAYRAERRRPAVPTPATRCTAAMGMVGGLGWVVLAAGCALVRVDATVVWLGAAVVLHVAVAMSVVAGIGLWWRHGGLGPLVAVAGGLVALTVPFVVLVWPIPAWTLLLGAASALFGGVLVARRIEPRLAAAATAVGMPAVAVAVAVCEFAGIGRGEDFAFLGSRTAIVTMLAGMAVTGLGIAGLSHRLFTEPAADRRPQRSPNPVGRP